MISTFWWIPTLLTVIALGVIGLVLSVRAWPRHEPLTDQQRKEMAGVPMAASQKGAWWGLAIGITTLAVIAVLLGVNGVADYWENDAVRLIVSAIFVGGLIAHLVVSNLFHIRSLWKNRMDERERQIINRASIVQSPAIIIALAVWLIALTDQYHQQGTVPVVFLYLMFGSTILVMMIAQSAGVLLGHLMGSRHG